MNIDPPTPAVGVDPNEPQLQLQSVYLKDCSFEAPNGPRVAGDWNPQVSLDLHTAANVLSPEVREIVLTVTVGARQADANVFLVEVQQAGVFLMKNLSEEDARRAIGSVCPNVLFPYARAAVSQLITQGGFPQFLLPPVNFDALYARSLTDVQNLTRQKKKTVTTLTPPLSAPAAVPTRPAQVADGRSDPGSEPAARPPLAVLGAGSWGTALAIQFARTGRPTRLWGRDAAALESMARERRNRRYLPEAPFPAALDLAASLEGAVDAAVDVLVAVPSSGFRALLEQLAPRLRRGMRLAWATKGFELATGLLPHQVARQVLGGAWPTAVLSGPTFAREVGNGLPTAMTIASMDEAFATALALDLSAATFRAYTASDIVGVEVGGAVKNVLAIGAGLGDGLGFGANTRVALITRGLVEMTRLGVALGAQRETFMGLAGLGDLVLSCTDSQSRNRRFGLALASGAAVEEALRGIAQTVEGYPAARAVRDVAARARVSMPISEGIYRVLYEQMPAAEVVRGLMTRPVRPELD